VRTTDDRLRDILAAIEKIEGSAAEGKELFSKDEYRQIYVIHHIQIIGEAVRACIEDLSCKCPEYPWKQTIGMRNILVHQYFGINLNEVWAVIEKDLPILKKNIQQLLSQTSL